MAGRGNVMELSRVIKLNCYSLDTMQMLFRVDNIMNINMKIRDLSVITFIISFFLSVLILPGQQKYESGFEVLAAGIVQTTFTLCVSIKLMYTRDLSKCRF